MCQNVKSYTNIYIPRIVNWLLSKPMGCPHLLTDVAPHLAQSVHALTAHLVVRVGQFAVI